MSKGRAVEGRAGRPGRPLQNAAPWLVPKLEAAERARQQGPRAFELSGENTLYVQQRMSYVIPCTYDIQQLQQYQGMVCGVMKKILKSAGSYALR